MGQMHSKIHMTDCYKNFSLSNGIKEVNGFAEIHNAPAYQLLKEFTYFAEFGRLMLFLNFF